MGIEIETDCETVEAACASKQRTCPEYASLAALKAERTVKARRRAVFFAARDRAFARAGFPAPKVEVRNGVRIERRGTVPAGCRAAGYIRLT